MTDPAPADEDFEALLDFIRTTRAFDFTGYKRSSLRRRIEKRMYAVDVSSFEDYQHYLATHEDDFAALFNTVLINVTGFLRDPAAWEYLATDVLPGILERKDATEPVRVWSAGCASGEEAYSLALLLNEALGEEAFRSRVKIYATDVDEEALTAARHARYPLKALEGVFTPEEIERHFAPSDDQYVFRKELRRSIIFGRHDLVQDAPISHIDLIVCRNTLMYFTAETQRRILANFHFALNEGGALFLGKSEVLVTRTNLFVPVDLKRRIFTKARSSSRIERMGRPSPPTPEKPGPPEPLVVDLRDQAFEAAPLALLAISRAGVLTAANNKARSLFGLRPIDVDRPFRDLDLSYRPVELRSRIDQAFTDHHPILLRDVEARMGTGVTYFDIQITPLAGDAGTLITFTDVGMYHGLREEVERSKRDLETAYEELQSTVEELETTNEELQSTNEELETTNEELHSMNEELETMNEELQSTVEELETTNDELRLRTGELDSLNGFLRSILTSLQAAVVVVDRDFAVRIWNVEAEDMWGLRPDEVEGKHFLNLEIGLPVERLRAPVRLCLSGESANEQLTVPAINRRGQAIECRVTCTPLIGQDEEINGALLLIEADGAGQAP
ncbi:MAG TPA: CheR family methyltransferase [Acidimicrobiales bacterium]|nr:CheR family methyltransferase [Acidimicrobiales bacterium]